MKNQTIRESMSLEKADTDHFKKTREKYRFPPIIEPSFPPSPLKLVEMYGLPRRLKYECNRNKKGRGSLPMIYPEKMEDKIKQTITE